MGRWLGVAAFVVACGGASAPRVAVVERTPPSPTREDPDRDHDGIPNECDACPDAPETFNGNCDEDGCPDGCIPPSSSVTINIHTVLVFAKQSSKVSTLAQPLVDDLVHTMLGNADALELVAIVGHASHDETDGEALALARANNVKAALVAGHVDASHVVTHAMGAREANDPDEALNRRVTFVVLRAEGREQNRIDAGKIVAIAPIEPPSKPHECEPVPATCSRSR